MYQILQFLLPRDLQYKFYYEPFRNYFLHDPFTADYESQTELYMCLVVHI